MSSLHAIQITETSPRKPLKSISNRKRQRSPSANCNTNKKPNLIQPPNKKQKMSKSDQKEEENDYTFKTITIKRMFDNKHFNNEDNDKDEMKFNVLNDNWVELSDIFRNGFKYSSTSNPTLKQTEKKFINALKKRYISYPLSMFYTKFNKKFYVSEKGFCILLFFMRDFDKNNLDVEQFSLYRFYYRKQIFGRKILGFNIKKPVVNDNIEENICKKCCLEDIDKNFVYENENPCDCGCKLHLNCSEINSFTMPMLNSSEKWFCPFCIASGLSMTELIERRLSFNDNGIFEIEKVINYDIIDDKYIVKWKHYPNEANCKTEISFSFMELINDHWKHKQIPLKAQNSINLIMKNVDNDNDNDNDNDTNIDTQMANLDIEIKSNNDVFIAVKLDDIMDSKYIIRRQKYTKLTYERFKLTQDRYRKWLQKEVKNETAIGMDLKREMKYSNNDRLPKYHLRSINKDWDCDLPRIHDIIINFLRKDWNKWEHNVSHKSFVIGDIIDPENPAKKYCDQGVHDSKAYGLFAIKKIIKDTLLFEYSGCVKPIGDASRHLDHLETELDQTTLFDLIGHLDKNRSKLFWGAKPNDQLVIDPSRWHNEGVYMNDYRDRVMDDPDDDEQIQIEIQNNQQNNNNNNNNNNNKMRKQNIKFYEVLVNNWPRVFAVAIADIQPGQELLGDYGSDFWSNFRIMMKRQNQLAEIKKKMNDEWQEKYNKLEIKYEKQENEIERLKKALQAFIK